ncbi:lysoplasmalogenase family protein [Klebsiella pneumoniae subsp. pneumoniae]|nr:lysoplasmalogenase family protein [Klebsiella pneumoniae subsp. pneumoniae]
MLLLAWQAPMFNAISYLVLAGLCASLLGDALTLLPRQRVMYTRWALSSCHICCIPSGSPAADAVVLLPLPLVLLVFGALLMAVIWSRLEEMKMPVLTFIGMTLVMVWLAGELWFARPTNTALSGFAGAALLLLSNAVLAGEPLSSPLPRR